MVTPTRGTYYKDGEGFAPMKGGDGFFETPTTRKGAEQLANAGMTAYVDGQTQSSGESERKAAASEADTKRGAAATAAEDVLVRKTAVWLEDRRRHSSKPFDPHSYDITSASFLSFEKLWSLPDVDAKDEECRKNCVGMSTLGEEHILGYALQQYGEDSVVTYAMEKLCTMEKTWKEKVKILNDKTAFFLLSIEYIFQFLCDPRNTHEERSKKANLLLHFDLKKIVITILASEKIDDAAKILCFRILYAHAFGKEDEAKAAREELDKSLKAPKPNAVRPQAAAAVVKPSLTPDQIRQKVQEFCDAKLSADLFLQGAKDLLEILPPELSAKVNRTLTCPRTRKERIMIIQIFLNEFLGKKNQVEPLRKELIAYSRFIEIVETSIRNVAAEQPILTLAEQPGISFAEALAEGVKGCEPYVSRTTFSGHCLLVINATRKQMRVSQNQESDAAEFPTRIAIEESERKHLFCDFSAAKKFEFILLGKIQASQSRKGETYIDSTFLEASCLELTNLSVFSENHIKNLRSSVPVDEWDSHTVFMNPGVMDEFYPARGLTDAEYLQLKQSTSFFRHGEDNLLLVDLTCIAGKIGRIFPRHIVHFLRREGLKSLGLRYDGRKWQIVHLIDPIRMIGDVRFLTSEKNTSKGETTYEYETVCRFVLQITKNRVQIIDKRSNGFTKPFVLPCVLSETLNDPSNPAMSTLDDLYKGIISGRDQITDDVTRQLEDGDRISKMKFMKIEMGARFESPFAERNPPKVLTRYTEKPLFRKVASDAEDVLQMLQEASSCTTLARDVNGIVASYSHSGSFYFTAWQRTFKQSEECRS